MLELDVPLKLMIAPDSVWENAEHAPSKTQTRIRCINRLSSSEGASVRYNRNLDAAQVARCFMFLAGIAAAAQEAPAPEPQVFRLGAGIAPPFVVAKAKPDYSAEALLAKLEGGVLVSVTVDGAGQPRDIHVDRPLGLGLDESAIENVRHWQFRPGTKDGIPVAVQVNEEVFFHTARTLRDWHAVRAVFQTPEGAARPIVIKTKFPATVVEEENAGEENASVTISFDIDKKGVPANARVEKSSNAKWEKDLLAALADGWRFRPGMRDGKPLVVRAWFEFVRGSHSPIPAVPIPPAFIAR
jgi:TonB family protein